MPNSRMASITSVVATGSRMKSSGRLMRLPPLPLGGPRVARRGGGIPFHDLHLGPRNQPQLAVGDDDLARVQALLDDGQARDRLAGLDRARLHRAVGLDHVDELARLA